MACAIRSTRARGRAGRSIRSTSPPANRPRRRTHKPAMIAQRIAVIGAGAWGTALANVIARAGRAVTLWARDPAVAQAMLAKRESPRLPGVRIDERVALAALSG